MKIVSIHCQQSSSFFVVGVGVEWARVCSVHIARVPSGNGMSRAQDVLSTRFKASSSPFILYNHQDNSAMTTNFLFSTARNEDEAEIRAGFV